MDGTEVAHISGDVDWQQRFIPIPANLHDIEWVYSKNHENIAGLDTAWVDQVAFTPTEDSNPSLNQTISIEGLNPSQIFSDPIAIAATASSFLPVQLSVLEGPAVFHGNVLVPLAPGTVTIRASQPGDAIFFPAPSVDRQVTYFAGVAPNVLAANTPELSVDVSGGDQNIVETLALEPDGKLIAAGSFNFVHGERRWNIARFNADLTLDKTWHPKIEGGTVFASAVIGHYLFVGGDFTSVNQVPRAGLAKVSLVDGTLDSDWNPAPNGLIWAMATVENQLLVGGAFNRIGGVPRNFVAKLNPTGPGSADPVWAPGPNGVVNSIALTGTNLFIAGSFDNIRGVQARSVAKIFLHGTGERDLSWNAGIDALGTRSLVATPTHVFAGGYYRSNVTSAFGVAGFSAANGTLAIAAYPGRNAHKVAVQGNTLYTGFWADGRLGPIVERLSIPNSQVDSNWVPSILEGPGGGLATRVTDLLFRGEDLYVAGDFISFAGSPGSGVALLPTLEGAPTVKAISTTMDRMSSPGIIITPHPADTAETTHFHFIDIQNGTLFKPDPLLPGVNVPLDNGSFITRAEATNGLRFMPAPGFVGTGTFKVLASKTPFLSGVGGGYGFGAIPVLADRIEQLISYSLIADTPYDVGSVPLDFVASSGLPLSFTVTGPAHIVSDNILRFHGVGEVMVVAQQFGNELYKPSARVGTLFNITKGRQSISFEPLTDSHIATIVPLRATSSSGLPVHFSVVSGPAVIANNTVTFTAAGEVTIRASQPGDAIYNPAVSVEQTVLVTGRPQTISFFPSQPIPFNRGSLPMVATASSGLPVTFRLVSGPATLSTNTLHPTGAGTVLVEARQAGDSQFAPATAEQTFLFTRGTQTIQFEPIPQLSVSNTFRLRATASTGFPVTFSVDSNAASIDGDLLTIQRPGRVIVYAQQLGNENYEPSPAHAQVLDIPRLPQTLAIDLLPSLSMEQRLVTLSGQASSGLPVQFRVTGPATVLSNQLFLLSTGTITIYADQPGNETYAPADTVSFSATIRRGNQTIQFEPLTNLVAGRSYALRATASSGLPVTFEILGGSAVMATSNLLFTTGLGPLLIAARQSGNTNYFPAPEAFQAVDIAKSPQVISITPPGNHPLATGSIQLQATASSGLPVSFELLAGPATVSGANLSFTGAGIVQLRAVQAGNHSFLPARFDFSFEILKNVQTLDFPAIPSHLVSDRSIPLLATASSGLPVEYFVISGPATISSNSLNLTAVGEVVVEARQPGNDRFESAPPLQQSFNVLKGVQSITFPDLPPVRLKSGPVTLAATASSGLPVQFGILSGPATLSSNLLTPVAVGEVKLIALQSGNENYEPAAFVEKTLRIDKALQNIQFNPPAEIFRNAGPFRLEAIASSGLAVRYLILSGPALLSGEILTILDQGVISIRAFQPGDANHEPAPDLDRTIRIVPPLRPSLSLQREPGSLTLQWSTNQTGFFVEESSSVGVPAWTRLNESASVSGEFFILRITKVETNAFFRLNSPTP